MVNVIGLGYIGLPTALMLASHGVEVVGTDYKKDIVDSLNAGHVTFEEEGLDELYRHAVQGGIRFSHEYEKTDIYIVAVATPYDKFSKKVDAGFVCSAVECVLKVCEKGAIICIESTVSPGTIDKYVRPVIERAGFTIGQDIHLVHAPERIIPGRMLIELRENDRIIGSNRPESAAYAKQIYEKVVTGGTIRLTDDLTAEMCKLTENTFRDINIAYANELSKVCDRLGIDVFKLIELANCHPRVNVHTPGVGVGGHCIAVDPWFIHEKFEDITPLIYEARLVNDGKPAWTADRIARDVQPGAKIAVLGMSFKANIDDTRESPSVLFANILKARGYEVLACEPYIQGDVAGYHNYSLEEAMAQCDYAVITLMHNVFKENKALIAAKPYYDCVGLMEK